MNENEIGTQIIKAALAIHKELGPGLLESVYEVLLADELQRMGYRVERQVPVPIRYCGRKFDEGFRVDLMVEGLVIVELKSVECVSPAHKKQVLTYLKLTNLKLGYLINFGAALLKDGITRVVNNIEDRNLCASAPLREEKE